MTARERRLAAQVGSGLDMMAELKLLRLWILRLAESTNPADPAAGHKSRLMVTMMEALARLAGLQARARSAGEDELREWTAAL